MAQFKFTAEAKQIFLDVYNDPSVSSLKLAKEITKRLREKGFLEEKEKISNKLCRVALEDKLDKKYINRPRVKHEALIEFEEETTTDENSVLSNEEEALEEEEVLESEPQSSNYQPHPNEPAKFEF